MGLSISLVGSMRHSRIEDSCWLQLVQHDLCLANELLQQHGYAPFKEGTEPKALNNRCPKNNFGYSAIHYLRRAYARHLLYPELSFESVPENAEVTDDDAQRIVKQRGASHLVCHSDTGGMYIPHDFEPILADRRLEGEVGSSYRLMEELQFVAPAIRIRLGNGQPPDDEVERLRHLYLKPEQTYTTDDGIKFFVVPTEEYVWFSLYESARLSIEHGILIWFC